jgi:hypothetical protein
VFHKAILSPEDVEDRIGFRLTTPFRTLLDVAAGGISQEQLEKAVSEALRRGLVRKARLLDAARGNRHVDRLLKILEDERVTAN